MAIKKTRQLGIPMAALADHSDTLLLETGSAGAARNLLDRLATRDWTHRLARALGT